MGTYYDVVNEISTESRVDSFLDKLIELNDERNSKEIKKILTLNSNFKSINNGKQNTENNTKLVSVKSNDYTKKTMDVIKYIIARDMFTIWIENVLSLWINKLNKKNTNEISMIIKSCEFKNDYEFNRIVNFIIDESLWDSFVVRCRRSDLTRADGLKYALNNFIIDNH